MPPGTGRRWPPSSKRTAACRSTVQQAMAELTAAMELEGTMARIFFSLTLMASLLCCSTPDGGDMDDLIRMLRNMKDRHLAAQMEARHRTLTAINGRDGNEKVADVECTDADGNKSSHPIILEDVRKCMLDEYGMKHWIPFGECMGMVYLQIADRFSTGPDGMLALEPTDACNMEPVGEWAELPNDWDPYNIEDDVLARSLLSSKSPPDWAIAVGIVAVGAGGLFVFASGWGAVLCPLDVSYGCPGNPVTPTETPGDMPGNGGDR